MDNPTSPYAVVLQARADTNQWGNYVVLLQLLNQGGTVTAHPFGDNEALQNATIHFAIEDSNIHFNTTTEKITLQSAVSYENITLYVAIYQGGRLVDIKQQTVSVSPGSNELLNPLTDYKDADEIKIMLWNTHPLFGSFASSL